MERLVYDVLFDFRIKKEEGRKDVLEVQGGTVPTTKYYISKKPWSLFANVLSEFMTWSDTIWYISNWWIENKLENSKLYLDLQARWILKLLDALNEIITYIDKYIF